jgi:hypothetical protein
LRQKISKSDYDILIHDQDQDALKSFRDEQIIDKWHREFTEKTGYMIPQHQEKVFPADKLPCLGPFGGETDMEAINRCLVLFGHLNHISNPQNWTTKYVGNAKLLDPLAWLKPQAIGESFVPPWMRVITVTFDWYSIPHTAFKMQLAKQGRDGEFPGSVDVELSWHFDDHDVLNSVRAAFDCPGFKAQLDSLEFHFDDEDSVDDDFDGIWIEFSPFDLEWEKIRDLLWGGSTPIRCPVDFCPLEYGEEVYQDGSPPNARAPRSWEV